MPTGSIRRVNHTGFTVPDLGRASAFLRDVLGFTISATTRQSGPAVERMIGVPGAELDIAFATHGDSTIELICYVQPRSGRARDLRHCDTGFAHIAFEVEDIERMAARPCAPPATGCSASPRWSRPVPARAAATSMRKGPDGIVIELQQAAAKPSLSGKT